MGGGKNKNERKRMGKNIFKIFSELYLISPVTQIIILLLFILKV